MPFLIVIGAAYAAYHVNANQDGKQTKIDPSINVRGKSILELLPAERETSIMELPVGTISFFEGDYKAAAAHLESRCQEILQANPWLAGRLMPMPNLKVLYDPKGADRPPGIFQVFEPESIPLKHSTPYGLHSEMLRKAVVASNAQLVGQNRPLWRVSVIPDAGEWGSKFAITVTMSHAIGDAHTYYKLYNMLHCDVAVETLDPIRAENFKEAVHEYMGKPEATFVDNLLSSMDPKKKEEALGKKLKPKEDVEKLSLEPEDVVERLSFEPKGGDGRRVSAKDEKSPLLRSFKMLQELTISEPNVIKMFYVNEHFLTTRKGRRGSVFEAADSSDPSVAAAALTANSIISSWFFRINEAAIGVLMMNMRHRLTPHQCNISDLNAGNYVHALICNEDDFVSASAIQNVVHTRHRQDSRVADFDTERNTSMCVNWANFYNEELKVAQGCRLSVHLPIYNTKILEFLPNKISVLNLFTARCAGNNQERRAGAFVVCQESVWEKMRESGIVQEVIYDM